MRVPAGGGAGAGGGGGGGGGRRQEGGFTLQRSFTVGLQQGALHLNTQGKIVTL